MRSPRLKSSLAAVLIYACVAILLVVGTVQAAHICGLPSAETYASAQNKGAASPTGPFCVMCLLIHSAVAVLLVMMAFSPHMRRAPRRFNLQVRLIPTFTSFELYVRPPPAW